VPDSTVPDDQSSKLLDELARKAMLFKFANHLATEKSVVGDNFEVTNDLMKQFESFLKERDFKYEEDSEIKLRQLRETAEKERYGKSFSDGIDRMEKMIESEKARAFDRYDSEIRKALRLEIIDRMKGDKAAIQASFRDDKQLQTAVGILKNKALYNKMLSGLKK
jgi:carboxyl-terminal processing protease